eukprot:12017315-Prorocentrum_lima.AAC.1
MTSSLVGSEMCIRDSIEAQAEQAIGEAKEAAQEVVFHPRIRPRPGIRWICLLYTSDAADDM